MARADRIAVVFLPLLLAAPAAVLGQVPTPTPLYLHCPVTGFDGRNLVALAAVNPGVVGSQLVAVDQNDGRIVLLTPREGGNLFNIGACDRALGSTPVPVSVSRPLAIAAAPLRNRADRDLVVLGRNGVLPLFSGAGGFMPPVLPVQPTPTPARQFTPIPAGDDPQALTIADFDRDGNRDVAVATNAGNSIEVLFGTTDETVVFGERLTIKADFPLSAVASDDFDGDAQSDLAAISSLSSDVLIFLRETDGSFKAPLLVPAGQSPTGFAIGRFNDDGIPDLAVLTDHGRLHILIGEIGATPGEVSFSPRETFDRLGTPEAIAVGKFDVDLFDDVAVAVSGSPLCPTRAATPAPEQTPEATPDPQPTETPEETPETPTETPTASATATPTSTATPEPAPGHCVLLYLSNDVGDLTPGPAFPVGANPRALVVARLDSDRRTDIISLNSDANEGLTILLSGNPSPTPTLTVTNTPTITGTPTETPIPTETPTREPEPPPTPRPTNTCPPDQICVQGEGCVTIVGDETARVPWPAIGLAALAWLLRRRR